jgi:hypothetical protein
MAALQQYVILCLLFVAQVSSFKIGRTLHVRTTLSSSVKQEALQTATGVEPDWLQILDMSQISNLCDERPAETLKVLKKQGRGRVRVEQRTLGTMGVRFNIVEYSSHNGNCSSNGDYRGKRVLSVRGTKTFNNFLQNMDAGLTVCPSSGIKAHSGYLQIAQAMADELLSSDKEFLTTDDDFPLSITGHSLGGAVGVLLSYLLSKEGIPIDKVYTFGMPQSFVDKDSAQMIRNTLCVIQTEHLLDPICAGTVMATSAAATAAAAATGVMPLLQNITDAVPMLQGLLQPVKDIAASSGTAGPLCTTQVLLIPEEVAGVGAIRYLLDDEAREEWRVLMKASNPVAIIDSNNGNSNSSNSKQGLDGPRSDLPAIVAAIPTVAPALEYHYMGCYQSCLEALCAQ